MHIICKSIDIFIFSLDLTDRLGNIATDKTMKYLYYFANTSLVVRLLTYLSQQANLQLESVTVIYLVDRWVVRIRLKSALEKNQKLDFQAVLNENGYPFEPTPLIEKALRALETGLTLTEVMNRYHVVVVSHGKLQPANIEDFRVTFVRGLGYCPPSLV